MSGGQSPLQNRVTPFGDVVAIAQRGLFIGNRGIIHDPATKTLLGRRWTTKAWLVCLLDYKGRHREVMGGRSWTELFFLDEAVALAAGHRPCFFCRRRDAEAFRAAWETARGWKAPLAPEMDAGLWSLGSPANNLARRPRRDQRIGVKEWPEWGKTGQVGRSRQCPTGRTEGNPMFLRLGRFARRHNGGHSQAQR